MVIVMRRCTHRVVEGSLGRSECQSGAEEEQGSGESELHLGDRGLGLTWDGLEGEMTAVARRMVFLL